MQIICLLEQGKPLLTAATETDERIRETDRGDTRRARGVRSTVDNMPLRSLKVRRDLMGCCLSAVVGSA